MEKYLGLDIKRLNRRSFFWTILVSSFLFVGLGLLVDALYKAIFNIHTTDGEPTLIFVPFIILWWVYAISCVVRRLHDTNVAGWWVLTILVPFANMLLLVWLFFAGGTTEKNRYGDVYDRTFILGLGI